MKRSNKRLTESGFTLVEIAIVLVIIGLLLGGILKGQEMITQAKIKNVINDFNGVTAAVNSYQDRYRALPGDDATADVRWSTQGAVKGNGNGAIEGKYNNVLAAAPTTAQESNLFWWHLRLGGFVPGSVTAGIAAGLQPPNATNGIIGVQSSFGGLANLGFSSNIVCSSNLPDKIAVAVDTQMDDGTPIAGEIRGMQQAAPNPDVPGASNVSAYQETGQNQYLLCKNL
ncbi:MAG TPA: prepilin-type N-terminal cleavage/methylation domain-containing protein [Burkholderiales bacterium]|nr:prepilin-type N-terminal cleavage/methylation domain-containing protein [Burkholderiales bacterium]HYA46267.1 prepilin-type N-terminal cleavage/methylation domain-containing protein [Burkholderiales bacterium]